MPTPDQELFASPETARLKATVRGSEAGADRGKTTLTVAAVKSDQVIRTIKCLRRNFELTLREAKRLVDRVREGTRLDLEGLPSADALSIMYELQALGAEVTVESPPGSAVTHTTGVTVTQPRRPTAGSTGIRRPPISERVRHEVWHEIKVGVWTVGHASVWS